MVKAKTKISPADIVVCVIAVVASVILIITSVSTPSNACVMVSADGFENTYSLTDDRTVNISSGGYDLTLEIKDGAVRILKSSCHDKICVSTGWIKDQSKIIVCAPAKVVVRIDNDGGDSDVDFIAGR